jgi:hypothetical protein
MGCGRGWGWREEVEGGEWNLKGCLREDEEA